METQLGAIYHRGISRTDAFRLLQATGENGAYLVRDSETLRNARVLTLLAKSNQIVSYRLTDGADGRIGLTVKTIDGKEKWNFYDSFDELVEACKGPKSPTLAPLTIPVECKFYKDEPGYIPMSGFHATEYSRGTIKRAQEAFLNSINCSACGEIAVDAFETSCCHNILCEECLQSLPEQICKMCCRIFDVVVSHTVRRIVGNMPAVCFLDGCGKKMMQNEIKEHKAVCQYRLVPCPFKDCEKFKRKTDLAEHLLEIHADDVIDCVEKCKEIEEKDKLAVIMNENGDECRIGTTGKFYCGKVLNGPKCLCCVNQCGPLTGCNCSACMKLDVTKQLLAPKTYVNRDGFSSKKSSKCDNFYCGRVVLKRSSTTNECCGPKRGPNCEACQELQSLVKTRYQNVWP